MDGDGNLAASAFREELPRIPPLDEPADRHLSLLSWLTRLSKARGLSSPILVGCGAVELYTNAQTATGDVDIVMRDIAELSAALLELGFHRSSDQRFLYHPAHSILFEFPSRELRAGERTITIKYDGVDCKVISPDDLCVNRLEAFEASGGGTDLVHAYQIYHSFFDHLDHERLRERVRRTDVRESFRFIHSLHLETESKGLTIEEQAAGLIAECRRRRGVQWPTGLS